MKRKSLPKIAGALILAAIVWLYQQYSPQALAPSSGPSTEVAESLGESHDDRWVEVSGVVTRILSDDLEGSRHQRFIIQLPHGQTLLVAHNIDLAPKVPLSRGDRILAYGEFQWNAKGGVLHWTHHDPQGRRSGGWLEHQGKRYQ